MNRNGFNSITILCDQMIRLFAVCGSLDEANEIFRGVSYPTVFTWNAMLSAHEQHGESSDVLRMYRTMHVDGVAMPDPVTFLCALKACSNAGDINEGMIIHEHILATIHDPCVVVGNTLVNMYAKCGAMDDAQNVFDRLSDRNVVSWGVILTGYSVNGLSIRTLELFESMKDEGVEPSRVTYLCALKACSSIGAIKRGQVLHGEITKSEFECDCVLGSTLVDMYSKCDSLEDAHKVFDSLPVKDIVAWSAMIVGYTQKGHGEHSLELFNEMKLKDMQPGKVAYSAALKACAGLGLRGIEEGRSIHDAIIKHGFDEDTVLGSSIIDLYAKCGKLEDAKKNFDALKHRDPISWGAMIGGYAQNGHGNAALELFGRMSVQDEENINPSKTLFLSLLKACCIIGDLYEGRLLHIQVVKNEMNSDPTVANMLLDMYAKCGSLKEAHNVFDKMHARDCVSWGALVTGHVLQNDAFGAMSLFAEMLMDELPINEVVYLGALKACSMIKNLELARLIHFHIMENDFILDDMIGSTIIDLYVKCGNLDDARTSFDSLPNHDVVTWGTMMMGYLNQGHGLLAFRLFIEMQKKGLKPDKMALMCSLKACSIMGALDWGKWIHTHILLQSRFEVEAVLACNLLDMYAKSGSIEDAQKVFDRLSTCDAAAWGALVAGYASVSNFTRVRFFTFRGIPGYAR